MSSTPSPASDASNDAPASAWDRSRALRLAVVVGLPMAVFALISGALVVSQMHVARVLTVWGAPNVLRGGTAGMRFILSDGVLPLGEYDVRVLAPDGRVLGSGRSFPDGCAAVTFAVPSDLPAGEGAVRVEATVAGAVVEASVPVRLVDAPGPTPPPPAEPEDPERYEAEDEATTAARLKAPFQLHLEPDGGAMVSSVVTRLRVRATDRDGKPARIALDISLQEGEVAEMSLPTSTDSAGLAVIELYPLLDRVAFAMRGSLPGTSPDSAPAGAAESGPASAAESAPASAPSSAPSGPDPIVVRVRARPAQAVLFARTPIHPPGSAVRVAANTVRDSGLAFVDLHRGDLWISADVLSIEGGWANGSEGLPPLPGLYTFQASLSCGTPGRSAAVRPVLVRAGGPVREADAGGPTREDLLAAADAVTKAGAADPWLERVTAALRADELGEAGSDFDAMRLARAILDRSPDAVIHSPSLLMDTRPRDEARIAAFQTRMRTWLLAVGIILGLVFVTGVALFYRSGALALRRRWDALGEDAEPNVLVHPAKLTFVWIAAVTVAALAAVAFLLATITWTI